MVACNVSETASKAKASNVPFARWCLLGLVLILSGCTQDQVLSPWGDCALVAADTQRLECYDLAAAQFDKQDQPASSDKGVWWVEGPKVNPVDGSWGVYIGLAANEPPLLGVSQAPNLILRCQSGLEQSELSVYINWGGTLGSEEWQVQTRMGQDKPTAYNWRLSNSGKATFLIDADQRNEFLADLSRSPSQLAVSLQSQSDARLLITFDTHRFAEAFEPLRRACNLSL